MPLSPSLSVPPAKLARELASPPPSVPPPPPPNKRRLAPPPAEARPLPAPPPATAAGAVSTAGVSTAPDEDIELYGMMPSAMADDTYIPSQTTARGDFRRPTFVRQEPNAPLALVEDPREWDAGDVLRWLRNNSFDDFKSKFYANGFVGRQLLALKTSAFSKQGFTPERCDELAAAISLLRARVAEIKER
jgi:hypothetical protein